MKMLARLKYLRDEGFEIASLSGHDDPDGETNAKILFLIRRRTGGFRVCTETFRVDEVEMEKCCTLFFTYLSEKD